MHGNIFSLGKPFKQQPQELMYHSKDRLVIHSIITLAYSACLSMCIYLFIYSSPGGSPHQDGGTSKRGLPLPTTTLQFQLN